MDNMNVQSCPNSPASTCAVEKSILTSMYTRTVSFFVALLSILLVLSFGTTQAFASDTNPEPELFSVKATVQIDGNDLINGQFPQDFDASKLEVSLQDTTLLVSHFVPTELKDPLTPDTTYTYNFGNLPNGTYKVVIPENQIPNGYEFAGPEEVTVDGKPLAFILQFKTSTPLLFGVDAGALVDGKQVTQAYTPEGFDFGALEYILTDGNGNQHFNKAQPINIVAAENDADKKFYKDFGKMPVGTYTLTVDASTIPAGFELKNDTVTVTVTDTEVWADVEFITKQIETPKTPEEPKDPTEKDPTKENPQEPKKPSTPKYEVPEIPQEPAQQKVSSELPETGDTTSYYGALFALGLFSIATGVRKSVA